jgi:hypothetical protein
MKFSPLPGTYSHYEPKRVLYPLVVDENGYALQYGIIGILQPCIVIGAMSWRSQDRHYQNSSWFKYQAGLIDNTVPYEPFTVQSTPLQSVTICSLHMDCAGFMHPRLSATLTLGFYFNTVMPSYPLI